MFATQKLREAQGLYIHISTVNTTYDAGLATSIEHDSIGPGLKTSKNHTRVENLFSGAWESTINTWYDTKYYIYTGFSTRDRESILNPGSGVFRHIQILTC